MRKELLDYRRSEAVMQRYSVMDGQGETFVITRVLR